MEVSITDQIRAAIEASAPMTLAQIVTQEVREFIRSPAFHEMELDERYYLSRSAVQQKVNDFARRSNTKIERPILRRLIEQKTAFLLAKPFSIVTENAGYADALNRLFDGSGLRRKLKGLVTDAVKYGIGFMQPYVDQNGALSFMRLPAREVIPLWEDAEHERLSGFIRFYPQTVYEGLRKREITHAELWMGDGVRYFISGSRGQEFSVDHEHGEEENDWIVPHLYFSGQAYNWEKIPLIWLKYNDEELSLCYYLREMIDELNWQNSVTADTLRDVSKFIYVLRNYGGADLDEFVSDLRQSLAVKVDSDGGVDKLEAELNIDAVMKYLDNTRRDIYDFAAGVDTKDPDLGNASGTAIQFRYMDLQNDCEAIGDSLQDSMRRLKSFLDGYLAMTGAGDFSGETFSLLYNMDLPVNETDVIGNIRASEGIISHRTQLENHPWIKDADTELERIRKEREEQESDIGTFLTSEEADE